MSAAPTSRVNWAGVQTPFIIGIYIALLLTMVLSVRAAAEQKRATESQTRVLCAAAMDAPERLTHAIAACKKDGYAK